MWTVSIKSWRPERGKLYVAWAAFHSVSGALAAGEAECKWHHAEWEPSTLHHDLELAEILSGWIAHYVCEHGDSIAEALPPPPARLSFGFRDHGVLAALGRWFVEKAGRDPNAEGADGPSRYFMEWRGKDARRVGGALKCATSGSKGREDDPSMPPGLLNVTVDYDGLPPVGAGPKQEPRRHAWRRDDD